VPTASTARSASIGSIDSAASTTSTAQGACSVVAVALAQQIAGSRATLMLTHELSAAAFPTTPSGACAMYDADTYRSMDFDANRVAFFQHGVNGTEGPVRWFEIGCGATATLTKLVLDCPGNTVVAYEIERSAATQARATLRDRYDSESWQVINADVLNIQGLVSTPDMIITETAGHIASFEGMCRLVRHVKELVPRGVHVRCLPQQMATFYTPVQIGACSAEMTIKMSSKVALVKKLPFADWSVSDEVRMRPGTRSCIWQQTAMCSCL
jgi:hypothetical protein